MPSHRRKHHRTYGSHRVVTRSSVALALSGLAVTACSPTESPPESPPENEISGEVAGAPAADYPVYETLDDALTKSTLVVTGEPLEWEAREEDDLHFTVTTFEIDETLYGSAKEGSEIEIRQSSSPDESEPGSSVSQYFVHLEDIESEQILLFLSDSTAEMYNPINPMDGIHAIDQDQISSLQDNWIALPETVAELREHIDQYQE